MRSGPELLLLPLSQRVQIKALRLSWRKRGAPPSQSGPVSLVPPCPSGEDEHLEVHRLHGYLNESYSVYWQQRRKVLMTLKTTPLKTVTTDVGHLEEEEEEEELRDKREAAVEMTSSHFPAQHVTSHSSTAHSLEQDLMVDDRTQQDRRQD
ncbi:hypothetical protein AGIG_G11340 [Arapaima gigas]